MYKLNKKKLKLQCCVSFCRNTSHNVSTSEGQGKDVSFHDLPSEAHLRAAWLRALGKDDSSLTYPAVVCSQHFLYDDIYETQSGLRRIVTGAIPSIVQVCMICLDTDSKLILMSKHKLEKVYEKLTGQPFCLQGNLKQTLCVQCAQRLINFSRFGDKSLRARALMMDLVDKHELINREQKKIINRAKYQQKSTMVLTTLGLNNNDLRLPEHPSEGTQIQKPRKEEEEENRQTELDETGQRVVVKTEESDVSMSVDGVTEVKNEHNNDKDSVWNPLKDESITFQCTLCMEEFVHEHAYIQHACVHLQQNGEGDVECDSSQVCKPHTAVSSSSSHSSLITENKSACLPVPITLSSIRVSTSEEQGKGFQGALGKQDSHLPDSAVVCSQHFLNDDIYESKSGIRQIVTGAIPSTVQVCMICLDTDSKLILMSKHQLEKAYEKLTGHPSCYLEKRKQTLCLQCAQRLIDFSLFRFNSLRARAQIMDLVKKHESITRQHLKKISRAKPKSNIVMTMEGLTNSDLRILEHPSEDRQIQKPRKEEEENRHTELEETGQKVVVKTEESDFSVLVDGNTEVLHEHNNAKDSVWDPLKYESITFQCTLCMEEFVHEHAYIQHVCVHIKNGEGDGECDTSQVCKPHTAVSSSSSHSSLITENKQADPGPRAQAAHTTVYATRVASQAHATEETDTIQKTEPALKVGNGRQIKGKRKTKVNVNKNTRVLITLHEFLMKTQKALRCTATKNFSCQTDFPTSEHIEPVTNISEVNTNVINIQCNNSSQNRQPSFPCEICGENYKRKSLLFKHIRKTHPEAKPFTCNICQHKYKIKKCFTKHMVKHTIEKPYLHCKFCNFKTLRKWNLITHLRTHTGEKPYSCELCAYKFVAKGELVRHVRTHTGERPYSCALCEFRSALKSNLKIHMSTHTGEKPYYCALCKFRSALKSNLKIHMRTHTGEKQFSCELCDSKFADKNKLVIHMRTHTGEKPYSCELCEYKCAYKGCLVRHMRTHTGEKPYSCGLCEYKCADMGMLVIHMRTHTGEKPYSCELCEYKFVDKNKLVIHSRTHTGENPFSCELCEYKCADKDKLVIHMRTHTGD